MKDEFKYARATGSLSAMCRFLIEDLEVAVKMIDDNENWKVKSMVATIKHAKEVSAEVEFVDNKPVEPYPTERPLASGSFKDTNTGEVFEKDVRTLDDCNWEQH